MTKRRIYKEDAAALIEAINECDGINCEESLVAIQCFGEVFLVSVHEIGFLIFISNAVYRLIICR